MTKQQERLLEVARAQVGYIEKASNAQLDDPKANPGAGNYTKYNAWYGMQAQPWCAMFVSWCFDKAGLAEIAPKYAGCYAGIEWFKARGAFHVCGDYRPQPGDVIFFSSTTYPNGGAHTGIVVACDGQSVETIEGNTSGGNNSVIANGGMVCIKYYTHDYASIYGYGTPLWAEEAPEPEAPASSAVTQEQLEAAIEAVLERWNAELRALPGSSWSQEARDWAVATGLFRGDQNGEMLWRDAITREQLAEVLYRAAQS